MDTNSDEFDIEKPPPSLEESRTNELERLPPLSSRSIYRVPKRLRLVNENAYTPNAISIGPLHHGGKDFLDMEEHKQRYLVHLTATNNFESSLEFVRQKEKELRACYDETIKCDSDKFVNIILVDAAFIIGFLLRLKFDNVEVDEEDRIFRRPWRIRELCLDVLLLENQLPFFILDGIVHRCLKYTVKGERISIFDLLHKFFIKFMGLEVTEDRWAEVCSSKIEHLVDFLRRLHLPSNEHVPREIQTITTPSITELYQAGIKFEVGSSKNLFDLRFKNGILEIPKLTIDEETEISIRNLIAFEQCHCDDHYINDYVILMNRLINSQKDVDLVVKHGIVENRLSNNKQGSFLINNLVDGVILNFKKFYFAGLCEELKGYCGIHSHKWKADLKQNYFSTPWSTVSVIAGVTLLILTLIQTVCSIISAMQANPNGK